MSMRIEYNYKLQLYTNLNSQITTNLNLPMK